MNDDWIIRAQVLIEVARRILCNVTIDQYDQGAQWHDWEGMIDSTKKTLECVSMNMENRIRENRENGKLQ